MACHCVERVCVTFSIVRVLRESIDGRWKFFHFGKLNRDRCGILLEFPFLLTIIFDDVIFYHYQSYRSFVGTIKHEIIFSRSCEFLFVLMFERFYKFALSWSCLRVGMAQGFFENFRQSFNTTLNEFLLLFCGALETWLCQNLAVLTSLVSPSLLILWMADTKACLCRKNGI